MQAEQKYPWVSSTGCPGEGFSLLPTSVVLESVLSVKVAKGSGLVLGLAHVLASAALFTQAKLIFFFFFFLV